MHLTMQLDGLTPLMIAAAQGHLEIVSSLLENGAAVNKANEILSVQRMQMHAERRMPSKHTAYVHVCVTPITFSTAIFMHSYFIRNFRLHTSLCCVKSLYAMTCGANTHFPAESGRKCPPHEQSPVDNVWDAYKG
eukprot:1144160-Pelagomonas_calceolata.AAC.4